MLHKNRRWTVSPAQSPEDLAEKLTQHDWTGCTAWELQGYVFASDATSGDGAQEYCVLRPLPDGSFQEIESITFSWCSQEKALEYIRDIAAGKYDAANYGTVAGDRFTGHHGPCTLCA